MSRPTPATNVCYATLLAAEEDVRLVHMYIQKVRIVHVHIRVDDLSDPRIAVFLEEHIKDMRAVSPPESKHALDLAGLKQPDVTFWTVWNAETLVGCGAIKRLSGEHAELKSMRTAPSLRRSGVASGLLQYIIGEAQRLGYQRLSLETGSMPFFQPAQSLYAKHGFTYCAPFNGYHEDSNSVFMTLEL